MSRKPVRISDVPYEKNGTRRRIFSASLCRLQAYARLWIHDTDILIATPVQFLAAPVTEGHEFALQGNLTPWTDIISGFSANIGENHAFLYAHRPSIGRGDWSGSYGILMNRDISVAVHFISFRILLIA